MPSTLNDYLERLERELPPATLAEMRSGVEADMIRYHLSIGMWIRNRWRSGDPLPRDLAGLFPRHMDDLSSIVLNALWCRLNGIELSFEEHVARYEALMRRMLERGVSEALRLRKRAHVFCAMVRSCATRPGPRSCSCRW